MTKAMAAIRSGMPTLTASRTFGIPRTTLIDRKLHRIKEDVTTSGPKPYLTAAEENHIKTWIVSMGRIGFPLTKLQIKLAVKKILDEDGRDVPFTDNVPGVFP